MNPDLAVLIARFREAQDRGVAVIAGVIGPLLGVRLPTSPADWVEICGETRLCDVTWVNGIEVYTHGYGIALVIDGAEIDFDWGECGEPDGFDVWRLYNFACRNPVPGRRCPGYEQVRDWLDEAAARGELTRDTFLYYSPSHRSTRPTLPAHGV